MIKSVPLLFKITIIVTSPKFFLFFNTQLTQVTLETRLFIDVYC